MKFCLGFRSLMSGFLLASSLAIAAPLPDQPFLQDVAVRIQTSPALAGATFRKLCVDREGVVYVLTDKGVARVYDQSLTLDRSFRPLAGQIAKDITLSPAGDLYYLFAEQWLSNGRNGEPLGHVPANNFETIAVGEDGTIWLAGPGRLSAVMPDGKLSQLDVAGPLKSWLLLPIRTNDLPAVAVDGQFGRDEKLTNVTALARQGTEILVGTRAGYARASLDGRQLSGLRTNLPWNEITRIFPVTNGLWIGTSRGAVFQRTQPAVAPALPDGPNGIRYYASKRWLRDDHVVDLATDPEGHLWVLTKTGLNKIEFRTMTLAQKAGYFDKKIRQRHIRFGLTGERRLPNSGEVATSEMIDTDNDGGWTSYYLASQAFRFAATGSSEARFNAWDAFGALERLQTINPLPGFSSRTIERHGFKFSDADRWREVPGGDWDWKGHTSSDEIASQTLAHAVMWECVVKTDAERKRVADNFTRIVDHIIRNNWYLVDVDGKPTLWGRWHPEYVNWFPPTIVDRRLNSAEITASLQLAFAMTGKAIYKEKAYELFERHGYLTNILSAMKLVSATKGFIHQGNDMGDEWNHSDDELAFVTYWPLYRFAFDEGLKAKYGPAIRDHWEYEQPEGYPMWNFIYAGCGGATVCDAPLALWTLRGYPMDTISWSIQNSHRQDLTKLPANFMKREMKELLPPGERQIARCNTQPFTLDAGDNGHIEFPGDEYLFGYWLGRYLKLIE